MYGGKFQVYLLAENRLLREALTRILTKKADIRVVGAAGLSPQAEARIADLKPDILLADASALSDLALQLIPNVRRILADVKIVMIGMDADPELFLHAVRQGVRGYVLKDASAVEVGAAVRAVIHGEAVCPPSLLTFLFAAVAQSHAASPNAQVRHQLGLSRREQELIHMISEGLTNKAIAARLGLSQQTVKNHVHRMLRKVGARHRLGIVERWREVRLLSVAQLPGSWSRPPRSRSGN